MQSKLAWENIALGERARQVLRAHRIGAAFAAYTITGFLSANAFVLGGLAPFGVAFASAAAPQYAAPAILGATLGYLASYSMLSNIKYVCAMLLLFLIRWCVSSGTLMRAANISRQAICAVSLAVPLVAVTTINGGNVYDMVLTISEVLLACCAAYFFGRTMQALENGLEHLQQTDVTSIVITFCITVLALINLKVGGLSVGRTLAVVVVLLAAQLSHEAGGAIAGIAAGVAAGVLGGEYTFLMGTYGFGGLLAGVFAPLGRLASAGAFVLVNLFAVLAARQNMQPSLMVEVFLACVLAMLVPPRFLKETLERRGAGEAVQGETYKAMLTNKIGYVSGALRDVADTTRQVNEKLAHLVGGDISQIYHAAAEKVCRKCRRSNTCWQLRYHDTSNVLNDALGVLRRTDRLEAEDFAPHFSQNCLHLSELAEQMKLLFSEYTARETMRRKVEQVRGVVTDQFEGMALMIDAMGRDLEKIQVQDNVTAKQVREYMQAHTSFPDRVCCTLDGDTTMTLELTIPAYTLASLDLAELTLDLSDLCGRDFDLPAQRQQAESAVLTLIFQEKATYTIRWGASQEGNGGSRLCGDSYSYVDGQNGRVNLILSDGMGSGGAAAVDSTMTAELLKRLIQAGVSLDAALKLVNSALLVKSGEESLATIDITGIDLYTGKVEFYKAGAAPTFLRKSGKGGYVQASSLPVGILGGVSFEKNVVTLRDGDWIVMVSDGATSSGYEWLVSDLEHYVGEDPKQLSEQLLSEAKRRRNDGHEDDITVIAIRLEKGV